MTKKISHGKFTEGKTFKSITYKASSDCGERRRLEMKRRFGLLSYRRDRLERELKAIDNALITLDRQMQSHAMHEQLSICD